MLGAWLCLFDMTQVFALNMAYDFGLKQLSLHLILMAAVLVAPDLPRLADFFLRRQVLRAAARGAHSRRARRVGGGASATWMQVLAGVYLLVMFTNLSLRFWSTRGRRPAALACLRHLGGRRAAARTARRVAPADADYDRRWRRVIFDTPDVVAIQRTDDSVAHYGADVRGRRQRACGCRRAAAGRGGPTSRSSAPAASELRLAGEMDGHRIEARLRRVELDTFRLRQSPFRWVRPPDPFAG